MALTEQNEEVVAANITVFRTVHGYNIKVAGDGATQTVKLPPHVATFFRDKGVIV